MEEKHNEDERDEKDEVKVKVKDHAKAQDLLEYPIWSISKSQLMSVSVYQHPAGKPHQASM